MRLVKDFDMDCKDGKYIVKAEVGNGFPSVLVYDNRTVNDKEYYRIYSKVIQKIRKNKDCYVLYV